MSKVLLSRKTLAERWDYSSCNAIIDLEQEGVITRIPNLSSPRYSIDEIEKIESIGLDINPLSPIERKRLENQIKELKKERDFYKSKMQEIRMLIVS